MTWTVRSLVEADADEVAAVFRRSRSAAMPWLPVLHGPDEDRAFFRGEVLSSRGWGIDIDGSLAGFALVRDGWLNHLYVDAARRGQGIGSALLDAALQSSGDALQLWAFERNVVAVEFYLCHGFAIVDRTDGSGNEEREPDVRMSRGIRVRAAEPEDAGAIAGVHVAAWRAAYAGLIDAAVLDGLDPGDRETSWSQRLAAPDTRVLVATDSGHLVGFASHGPARDADLARDQQEWWELYAMYVHPDHWGRGVGTRLWSGVQAAVPGDVAGNVAGICLWVLAGNGPARAAYAAWGLAPDGATRERVLGGQPAPEVRYARWRQPLCAASVTEP